MNCPTVSLAIVLVSAALTVSAQQQPQTRRPQRPADASPRQTTSAPAESGAIRGLVVNTSGQPVRRAIISLRPVQQERAADPRAGEQFRRQSAETDEGGNFALGTIEPGEYSLSVVRNGYVNQQRLANGQRTFRVQPGGTTSDLKVVLTPQAVITGRVVDAEGEPIQSVRVLALRRELVSGALRWSTVENASTNDAGEFRLAGLPMGRYTVCAAESQRDRTRAGGRLYVATCYPNIGDVQQSPAVDVSPAAVSGGIDIRLITSEARTVSGTVDGFAVAAPATPPPGAQGQRPSGGVGPFGPGGPFGPRGPGGRGQVVRLSLARADLPAGVPFGRHMTAAPAGGTFTFPSVAPGLYTLTAEMMLPGERISGRTTVNVSSQDVAGIVIAPSPQFELPVSVTIDGRKDASADVTAQVQPSLQATDAMFGPYDMRRVASGQTPKYTAGKYRLQLGTIPAGTYLKEVRVGPQQVDPSGFELSGAAPVQVLLSDRAGSIDGTVEDASEQPVSSAFVVIAPTVATTASSGTGTFSLGNLAPGEYKVYAWRDDPGGAWRDPAWLARFDTRATTVAVAEGGKQTARVRVIESAQ